MPQIACKSLVDRVVIVTGGGRGLGKVMALTLMDAGALVVITGARASEELDATVAEGAGRGRIRSFRADVADLDAGRAVERFATDTFGPVSVLINNAARAPAEQKRPEDPGALLKFWEMSYDGVQRMLLTNVGGVWAMAQAVTPGMVARGFGRIINISTSRPTMVLPNSGIYGPCKAAVEASSRIWARDLEGTGVTVNVFLPGGPADTALIPGAVGRRTASFVPGKAPAGREGVVEGGLLPPAIMGPPILWLASDQSNGVTGRRFVARDWDADLSPQEASSRAEASRIDWPHIV